MGSLSSRPTVPATSQIVLASPTATTIASTPSASASTDSNSDTFIDTAQSETEVRSNNLLRRDRGTTGTIITSFRGLLGGATETEGRKSLLGE